LRFDKMPRECRFERVASTETEMRKAKAGKPL